MFYVCDSLHLLRNSDESLQIYISLLVLLEGFDQLRLKILEEIKHDMLRGRMIKFISHFLSMKLYNKENQG